MGSLRTYVVASLSFLALSGAAAQAASDSPLRGFAVCTGRLSAMMEFQWMFDGPGSEETQAQRAQMIQLVEAVIEPGQGPTVLNWQINAKSALSQLLSRAAFNDDPRDAEWAREQASKLVMDCQQMLIGW